MADLLFDEKLLKEEFEDDLDILSQLIDDFEKKRVIISSNIRKAIETNNKQAIKTQAHTLKGSIAIFGAEELVERLQILENSFENANQKDLLVEFEIIDSITSLLCTQLKSFKSS